jgi:charged multivesicular body protein 6
VQAPAEHAMLEAMRNLDVHCDVQQEQLVARSQEVVGDLLRNKLRERALLALKKKKLHEKQVIQLDQNILKLDEQVVALETTEQQVDTVSALRTANQAMKAMQRQMPLNEIEKLMGENQEAAEYVVRLLKSSSECIWVSCHQLELL